MVTKYFLLSKLKRSTPIFDHGKSASYGKRSLHTFQVTFATDVHLKCVLPPFNLNDEQLSHRINSSTVRQYKTETKRRRIARLAWTNNSSKTDLFESSSVRRRANVDGLLDV